MLEITLHLRSEEEVDLAAATLKKLFELRAQQPEDPKTHVHIDVPFASTAASAVVEEPDVTVEPELTPAPAITLEQVRAKFAQLNDAGKAAANKALVHSFGVKSLSEIPPNRYAELLAKAEQL